MTTSGHSSFLTWDLMNGVIHRRTRFKVSKNDLAGSMTTSPMVKGMLWKGMANLFNKKFNSTEEAKSSEHDMRRFREPWTPKRLMRSGQMGRRLKMRHLLMFSRRFEAEILALNGRRKKTSYLTNVEVETCPGSKWLRRFSENLALFEPQELSMDV